VKETRKHLRHRILRDFGLTPQSDFDVLIRRYSVDDYIRMIADIRVFMNKAEARQFDVNYITAIHPTVTQNLPLFVIRSDDEIDNVAKQIEEFDKTRYVEFWHSSFVTNNAVWGRIQFILDSSVKTLPVHFTHALRRRDTPINLELTCGASCREINLYPNITQAYMAFSKKKLNDDFLHDETIIANPERNYIVDAAPKIINLLSPYQKKLLDFALTLESAGAKAVSFDFTFANDRMFFWDFDTDDDEKVLAALERSGI